MSKSRILLSVVIGLSLLILVLVIGNQAVMADEVVVYSNGTTAGSRDVGPCGTAAVGNQFLIKSELEVTNRGDANRNGELDLLDWTRATFALSRTSLHTNTVSLSLELADVLSITQQEAEQLLVNAAAAWEPADCLDQNDPDALDWAIYNKGNYANDGIAFWGFNPYYCATDITTNLNGPTTVLIDELNTFSADIDSGGYNDSWNPVKFSFVPNLVQNESGQISWATAGIKNVLVEYDSVENECHYYSQLEVEAVAPAGLDTLYVSAATGDDENLGAPNGCRNSLYPCQTLQHAEAVAASGDEIRVAAGVYTGTQVAGSVLEIRRPITLTGGYTTTNWMNSDPIANLTVIDGEFNRRGIKVEYTIPATTTIQGFQITRGYMAIDDAAGIYIGANTNVVNNTISDNIGFQDGVAIFVSEDVNADVIGNKITDNSGNNSIVRAHKSTHINFIGNHVSKNFARFHPIEFSIVDRTYVANNVIVNNSMDYSPTVVGVAGDHFLHNNTIGNNNALMDFNAEVALFGSMEFGLDTMTLENNIIASNEYVVGTDGNGATMILTGTNLLYGEIHPLDTVIELSGSEIYTDPLFTDAGEGDYTLTADSPALGQGTCLLSDDIEGNSRKPNINELCDLGAYEYQVSDDNIFMRGRLNIPDTVAKEEQFIATLTITKSHGYLNPRTFINISPETEVIAPEGCALYNNSQTNWLCSGDKLEFEFQVTATVSPEQAPGMYFNVYTGCVQGCGFYDFSEVVTIHQPGVIYLPMLFK